MSSLQVPPPDPGTWLLDKIDAREQALTCQSEQIQAEIDALNARLSELGEAIENLRITRKTLLALTIDGSARKYGNQEVPKAAAISRITPGSW
ncbi:hypothetical protein Pve01_46620 [Planomonospora venezuelensis]|nr:hypothetical protein Pve01_46620 [Planomonospora venezuelensis]